MKALAALAAVMLAAACTNNDTSNHEPGRQGDTSVVTPPVTTSPSASVGQPAPPDTAHPDCGVTGIPVLTEQGIGELRQGRPVSDIKSRCDVISDSNERGVEGMMERVLVVRIAGEAIRASVTDDRIWRVELTSPLFKTADSLGVDTPLRKIARVKGAQFFPGEGGVYGFVPEHCGLSFRFSVPLRPPKAGRWTAESIDRAHGDAAVDRVLVTRCDR